MPTGILESPVVLDDVELTPSTSQLTLELIRLLGGQGMVPEGEPSRTIEIAIQVDRQIRVSCSRAFAGFNWRQNNRRQTRGLCPQLGSLNLKILIL